MISLRDDQNQAKINLGNALRAHLSVLLYAPTGFGKTVLASELIKLIYNSGKTVIFSVHRRNLITQTKKTFDKFNIPYGYIAAKYPSDINRQVQIASIATLRNRMDIYHPDFLFVDEAHLACANGWVEVIDYYKSRGTRVIGLSATPERLDGKPLGNVFDFMVEGPPVSWLIQEGHLSKYKAFAPDTVDLVGRRTSKGDYIISEMDDIMSGKVVLAGAVKHWKKYALNKRTIAFAPSVASSKKLADEFIAAGIPAASLDGESSDDERNEIINMFADREIMVLVNCALFSEGFDMSSQVDRDVPIEAVLQYSPTQSLAKHLQQIGRGLRKKDDPAIILDLCGNIGRLGLPDTEREWSLDGSKKGSRGVSDRTELIRQCPAPCFHVHNPAPICPECGHIYEIKSRTIEEIEGELKEIKVEKISPMSKIERGKARTLEDLILIGKSRGMKNPYGWAKHVITARQRKRGFAG